MSAFSLRNQGISGPIADVAGTALLTRKRHGSTHLGQPGQPLEYTSPNRFEDQQVKCSSIGSMVACDV